MEISEPLTASCDHSSLTFDVYAERSKSNNSTPLKPNFRKADYISICSYLSAIDWSQLRSASNSVQEFWTEISSIFKYCIDTFVPKYTPTKKFKLPKEIRNLASTKKKLYKNRNTSSTMKDKYRNAAKSYDTAVKNYFSRKEKRLCKSSNLKLFYSYVNKKLHSSFTIPPLKSANDDIITDNFERASMFNQYFSSVFTRDNDLTPDVESLVDHDINLSTVAFSEEDVLSTLLKLPNKNSRSPDGFTAFFLKSIAGSIAKPLSLLFEMSLQTGELPLVWKQAIITPVYKKGVASSTCNYRPISLTCICCKVMESIINKEIITYLLSHDLISKEQFGFLQKRSTCTQLLSCLNDFITSANKKSRTDCVYIDFAKAFDSVSHEKVITKLSTFGLKFELLQWLSSFLTNRSQRVIIDNVFSLPTQVVSGVPQGSVLGPLLFLLYINDIVSCIEGKCQIKLFADDSKFYMSRTNDDTSDMVTSLSKFSTWANKKWQLVVAHKKCSQMSYGNLQIPEKLFSIQSHELNQTSSVKDLGILFSPTLKFSLHCASLARKALSRCSLIFKTFISTDAETLLLAFKVYVRPLLESDTPVWSPYLYKDIKTIESIQRLFTRRLFYRLGFEYQNYLCRMNYLNLKSLEYRRVFNDLVMVYKILNKVVDLQSETLFSEKRSKYNLRGHSQQLNRQKSSIDCHKFFFSQRVIPIWNSLPDNVVSAPSVSSFKFKLSNINLSNFCKLYP